MRAERLVRGFTLVEMTIVAAMLTVLSTVVFSKVTDQLRRSQEAITKGNLGTLRSALSIYYSNMEGFYPTDALAVLTIHQHYLERIPLKHTPPFHPAGNDVSAGGASVVRESRGDWFYYNRPQESKTWGSILVNCIHRDLKGTPWSSY